MIIAGVKPVEPGFRSVEIVPNLGNLTGIDATIPHPFGHIRVDLAKTGGGGLNGMVELPQKANGSFTWEGRTVTLSAGKNSIEL
jgi:hypothetical protein